MPEHVADGRGLNGAAATFSWHASIEGRATGGVSIGGDAGRRVQREDRRVSQTAKGPRLRRPVEVSERSCEPWK